MSQADLWRLLCSAARAAGAEVRLEKLTVDDDLPRPRSGLVSLGSRKLVIIDRVLSPEARTGALAEALRGLDLGGVFLPPAVREILEGAGDGQDQNQD